MNGRFVCVRNGAEFLTGEKRRVRWRAVQKAIAPEATGRPEAPSTPRAPRSAASARENAPGLKTDQSPKDRTVSTGTNRKVSRPEAERRYYSSSTEEARYREWQKLSTGSVSVVARLSRDGSVGGSHSTEG